MMLRRATKQEAEKLSNALSQYLWVRAISPMSPSSNVVSRVSVTSMHRRNKIPPSIPSPWHHCQRMISRLSLSLESQAEGRAVTSASPPLSF